MKNELEQKDKIIKQLIDSIKWSIEHLESMEGYSIVNGAINELKQALKIVTKGE